jgi:hypothetical protein
MIHRTLAACLSLAVVLVAAPAAQAHVVHVDWKVADADLVVVAYFDNDLPADDAGVVLTGEDGTVVATGKTDDSGTWRVPKPPPGTYRLTIRALPGHEKTVTIALAPATDATGTGTPPRSTPPWLLPAVAAGAVVVLLLVWRKRGRGNPGRNTDPVV